jgi:hypothetical protein
MLFLSYKKERNHRPNSFEQISKNLSMLKSMRFFRTVLLLSLLSASSFASIHRKDSNNDGHEEEGGEGDQYPEKFGEKGKHGRPSLCISQDQCPNRLLHLIVLYLATNRRTPSFQHSSNTCYAYNPLLSNLFTFKFRKQ